MNTQTPYRFKIGICLNELQLPFEESLATSRDIGAEYIWFNALEDSPPVAELSAAEIDEIGERVAHHRLKFMLVGAGNPFKQVHLTDLDTETMPESPLFRKEFDDMVRSMEIAARLDVGSILVGSFAWPGEYSADKPTWPMRWLTRGGVIADVDMDKLVRAFKLMIQQADKYDVDLVLSMMPWNYTNTSNNFRALAERLGSDRIKVMWGPADSYNCGEWDAVTTGFTNVRPFVHSVHLKDVHVNDGLRRDFKYMPIGEGDLDYPTVLRNLRDARADVVLSLSTHFRPPSGSSVEAMRINYSNLMRLIDEVESEG